MEYVPVPGIASIINQMDDSLVVHCRLRLNPPVRSADEYDARGCG